jgi:YVTN family beta-propeller protein
VRQWKNSLKALAPALSLALGAVGLVPAGIAHADSTTALQISSFYQIVADTAHSHLFISQGSSSQNHIIVTDLSGKQVTTIAGQNGVEGIALSPDGKTLYAALGASHAVTAIDTATLAQTASYPMGNANTPRDVAVQSGKVWVSYDTGSAGAAAIGDINLTANTPAFETQSAMGGWYAAPEIAADHQDTGVLVAAEPGMSPTSVASYDTSVDPATVRAQSVGFANCSNQRDVAVVPGGSEFILACGAPYAHYRYSTADLSQQGSYASTNYPDAVAFDANGDVAAGSENGASPADLFVYRPNGDTPVNTYDLLKSGGDPVPRGLAWSPDGSKLFAVLLGTTTTTYSLHVIDGPLRISTQLTLSTGSSTFTYGATVHVTAHLGTTDTNRTVSIYAQPSGSKSKTLLKTGTVDASGNLTVNYKPAHSTTFSAVFSGDSQYKPASVTSVIFVRASVSETLSRYYASQRIGGITYRLFHRHTLMHVHVTVHPNKSGQCVKFELQEHYQGAWHGATTRCGHLDASSKISIKVDLTHADLGYHYRIRADYIRSSKDTTNLSNDSVWRYFIVKR